METKQEKGIGYKIQTSQKSEDLKDIENHSESHEKELLDNKTIKTEDKEQERTKIKKELFLTIYRKTLGSIKATCEKVGITDWTYFYWMKKDTDFNQKIRMCFADKLNDVEQQLNFGIIKGDMRAITYFLDRRHPLYMPKVKVVAPKAGEKSIEDMIIEGEWKDDDNYYETRIEQPIDNTKLLQDQKQEGANGPIQTESSSVVLLVKENKEKPNIEIQTGGIK
jgi:hypothetical protein